MRLLAPLAIALLVSCSSGSDLIDSRTLRCGPGEALEIAAGIDARELSDDPIDQRFDLIVEVSNNSHEDVTVTSIRVEQPLHENARFIIENSYRQFDQVIEEGKDHTFRLPMIGRGVGLRGTRTPTAHAFELNVTVVLSNGDSYRCPFGFG